MFRHLTRTVNGGANTYYAEVGERVPLIPYTLPRSELSPGPKQHSASIGQRNFASRLTQWNRCSGATSGTRPDGISDRLCAQIGIHLSWPAERHAGVHKVGLQGTTSTRSRARRLESPPAGHLSSAPM